MDIFITRFIESWIMPPGGFIAAAALGLLLLRWRPQLGLALSASGLGLLYLFSTSVGAHFLMSFVQLYPALNKEVLDAPDAGAIVVLAAGRNKDAPEYGGDTVSRVTLERLRYGVWLHRRTGLPLLVTGGSPMGEKMALAELMARVARDEYGVADVWVEKASDTTWENAEFSQQLLADKGVDSVLLVTHAWHMPRSVAVFEATGLRVTPAPTAFDRLNPNHGILNLLPDADSMKRSSWAAHELLGRVWYWLRAWG